MGPQGARVKRNRQLRADDPPRHRTRRAGAPGRAAASAVFAAALPLRVLPPLFNRYEGGGEYGMPVDGAVMRQLGSEQPLRSDVSSTLFLNEPDSYDGGELIVADTYGEHE